MTTRLLSKRALARIAAICAVGCTVAFLPTAPAGAVVSHFGSEGEDAGQFIEARGVAVDWQSGDVYVVDRNNSRVDKFGPEGEFLFAWGWGVLDGTEGLQTCTTTCRIGLEGTGAGEFDFPEGVAVDNDPSSPSYGDVYVFDARNNRRVEKFDPSGGFLLAFGVGAEGAGIAVDASGVVYVGGENGVLKFSQEGLSLGEVPLLGAGVVGELAVDGANDLYVEARESAGVHKYDSAGAELGVPRDALGRPGKVAVGPLGELFVNDEGASPAISEYESAGNEIASFDAGPGYGGLAFGEALGVVYVVGGGEAHLVAPPAPGPVVVDGSETASTVQPTSATLNASVDAEGSATSYRFEYGTSASYGTSVPVPDAELAASFNDVPVSAELSGLSARTVYHYRVVASNSAGTFTGSDETFTTLPPASIEGESATSVTATSAVLEANLNPLGVDTTYHFRYGPTAACGGNECDVPVPDAHAGAGSAPVPVSLSLQGLTPGSTYSYRLVASNALGTVEGAGGSFTTLSTALAGLPDGRAWEMVSPPAKNGVAFESIAVEGSVIQASEEGGALTYVAKAPIDAHPAGNRSIAYTQVLSTRRGGGWENLDISTPHERVSGYSPGETSEYRLFTPDLSLGVVEPHGATPLSPAATERTPYVRQANGEYTPIVTAANSNGTKFGGEEIRPEEFKGGVRFIDATPDFSDLVIWSPLALTSGASGGQLNLYDWHQGQLELVSVLPDGKAASSEGFGSALGANSNAMRGAISNDGTRFVFEAGGALYLRDRTLGKTARVDAAEAGLQQNGRPVFQGASADGSKIFFTDNARLTRDADGSETKRDLYMCEVQVVAGTPRCRLANLSKVLRFGEKTDVQQSVLGISESGRYVYFVANGVLAAGGERGDCVLEGSQSRTCDLYMADTVKNETRLLARLSQADGRDWGSTGALDLGQVTSRVSPNGRFLAFMSRRSLTGYDNRDALSGELDEEVYLYDAESARLVCASCNPSGARPLGVFDTSVFPGLWVDRSMLWGNRWLAGSIPGWTHVDLGHALYQSRYLSDAGRLFFSSSDALVPRDVNGVEDVYQYEPVGQGDCGASTVGFSARSGGCVGLISSGSSGEESSFLDASATGDDVFFLTAAKLTVNDVDSAFDVYDAHVCSRAVPCTTVSALSPPCATADACRVAPGVQPGVFGAPASATLSGLGNVVSPRGVGVSKRRVVTRRQKLAAALRACRRRHSKRERVACERGARRRYARSARAKRGR